MNPDPLLAQIEIEIESWNLQTASRRLQENLETVLREMHFSEIYIIRNELDVVVAPRGAVSVAFPLRQYFPRSRAPRPKAKVVLRIGEDKAEKWPEEKLRTELAKAFRRIVRYLLRRQRERNKAGFI